jgi:membrane-associated protease RseP (regulator of RpoE activity)
VAGLPLPPTASTEVDRLRSLVAVRFPVYETRITPRSVVFLVHADPATLESRFDDLRRELWEKFYVPQIRHEGGEYGIEVVRRIPSNPWSYWLNLALLILTVASTAAAGAFLWLAYRGGSTLSASDFVNGGIYFAAPLMAILGLHELAHYVLARHHHVEASLPYFVPVPPPYLIFGTFGAFISLREPIPSKKALLDIGAAGPLAGFVVAIPVTLAGMMLSAHSAPLSLSNCGPTILGFSYGNLEFGTSLFWAALGLFVPVSALANLHPLALAGWVGLLVTAINLLPAGQLDGGHVFRALFGDKTRYVSYVAVAFLFGVGFLYPGWFIFAILVLVLGVRHPPPLNDITPLDTKRYVVGALAVAILLSGFVIVPIAEPAGSFGVAAGPTVIPVAPPHGFLVASNVSITITNHDQVPRGFTVSSGISQVVADVNGTPKPLEGPALASFEANSTWVVVLPSGPTLTYSGATSFGTGSGRFVQLDVGASAQVTVTYLNTMAGAVTFSLTVSELCAPGGESLTQSETFTVG